MAKGNFNHLPWSQRPTGLTKADVRPNSQKRATRPSDADERVRVQTIGVRIPESPRQVDTKAGPLTANTLGLISEFGDLTAADDRLA